VGGTVKSIGCRFESYPRSKFCPSPWAFLDNDPCVHLFGCSQSVTNGLRASSLVDLEDFVAVVNVDIDCDATDLGLWEGSGDCRVER